MALGYKCRDRQENEGEESAFAPNWKWIREQECKIVEISIKTPDCRPNNGMQLGLEKQCNHEADEELNASSALRDCLN